MRRPSPFMLAAPCILAAVSVADAQTVYPVDQAQILAGSRFDFKVELPDRVAQPDIRVSVNGEDYAAAFGKAATYVEKEDGKEQSALILRDVTLTKTGNYTVKVSAGSRSRELTWNVYD